MFDPIKEGEMKTIQRLPNTTDVCRTCGRKTDRPFRAYEDNKVKFGCIDSDHNGHVWDSWHLRKEVKALQKKTEAIRVG